MMTVCENDDCLVCGGCVRACLFVCVVCLCMCMCLRGMSCVMSVCVRVCLCWPLCLSVCLCLLCDCGNGGGYGLVFSTPIDVSFVCVVLPP
jgi:hypothetical protein